MDPVTHTLVGASLAATRLGSRTRMATAALVVGANLPDIDVLSFAWGTDAALGFRRGWTHGVLALAILPALLAFALAWLARRRPAGTGDPPLSLGWLLALCYLAVLTHPSLDWLNVYGMRWLMPFDGTWFYGDSMFIVDPWLWLILGTGWLAGRRPTWPLVLGGVALGGFLLARTLGRAPEFAAAVAGVLLLLLAILLWRPRQRRGVARAATTGLTVAALFITAMIALHAVTVAKVRSDLERQGVSEIERIMVGPMPANPLSWDVLFVAEGRLRAAHFTWLRRQTVISEFSHPEARTTELWPAIHEAGGPAGFLEWTRFPWIEVESDEIFLMDGRYTRERTTGFGGTVLPSDSISDR